MKRDTVCGIAAILLGSSPTAPACAQAQNEASSLERTIPRLDVPPVAQPDVSSLRREAINQTQFSSRFILGAVNINGATAFRSDVLAQDFESLLASEVGEADLNRIVERITQRYRATGYALSYAKLPTQQVASGIVRVDVVEGYIDDLRIEGAGRDEAALKSIAAPLLADRPLRTKTLERVLGLMRDLSGVAVTDVRLARATDDPARNTLIISVARDAVRALAYSDNRGTVAGARVRLYGSMDLSSQIVSGDLLKADLFAIPGDGFRFLYGQITETIPIGYNGWRFGIAASASDQFQRVLTQKLSGTSQNLSVQLSYPILRSRALSAVARISLNDWRSTEVLAGSPIQRDRLRVARLSLDIARVAASRVDVQLSLAQGLGFDDITRVGDPLASRPDASGIFTKANLDIQVTHPLSDRVTLRFSANGQYSSRPVLSVEEFALGGSRIGRAYDFNTLTGDRGVGGGIELGYRIGDTKLGPKQVELFGYVDGGAVFQAGDNSGLPKQDALSSVGGGARFSIFKLTLSAELGIPLDVGPASTGIRGFASVAKTF